METFISEAYFGPLTIWVKKLIYMDGCLITLLEVCYSNLYYWNDRGYPCYRLVVKRLI
jgi:hypothetical protein